MLIELNKKIVECLTKTELGVIRFINENEERLSELSIVDIAFETYTSPATVSRAIRKANLHGFNELRCKCLDKANDNSLNLANEIMYQSFNETQNIIESISVRRILQAIERIDAAKKVYVFGRGLSEYVAEEFSFKLQLMNKDSMFIKDPNIIRQKSKQLKEDSLIVIFSLNGQTPELIEAARNVKIGGAKILCCCCNPSSELIALSDTPLIGYSEPYSRITQYEVKSRLPLYVISRMITEYYAQK
ncbi:MAG: MurR/RpiR family transcriptional regulator [Clostridia bacterium]|nr:MurR/RpiR family transcriptional regulator [Clostridia bacterium]